MTSASDAPSYSDLMPIRADTVAGDDGYQDMVEYILSTMDEITTGFSPLEQLDFASAVNEELGRWIQEKKREAGIPVSVPITGLVTPAPRPPAPDKGGFFLACKNCSSDQVRVSVTLAFGHAHHSATMTCGQCGTMQSIGDTW